MKKLIFKLLLLFVFFLVGLMGFVITTINVIFESMESGVNSLSQDIEEKLERLKIKK
jgi:hypothetical protein